MSMLRFLKLNQSLDGRNTLGRRYLLPDGDGPRVHLMPARRGAGGGFAGSSAGSITRNRLLSVRWLF